MTHLLHNKSRLSSSAANEQSKTKQQISIYSDIESLNFQTPQGCGIVLGKEVLLISSDHPKLNFSASLFKVQPLLHAAISQFSSVKRDWGTAPFVLLSCFNTNLGPQGTAPSTTQLCQALCHRNLSRTVTLDLKTSVTRHINRFCASMWDSAQCDLQK